MAQAVAAPASPPAAMETVHVELPGNRRYPIYIGDGLLDRDDLLQRHVPGQSVLVVTNETVAPLYLDRWAPLWAGVTWDVLETKSPEAFAALVAQV